MLKENRTGSRSLLEECMLLSGISTSSDPQQPVPVSSEHSYSLAAVDYSQSAAAVVKTDLDDSMYCCSCHATC